MTASTPNIFFLIWDACKYDYALEHASNLRALARNNLWFERAITPAPRSLPAHASLFTGQYPHEHGLNQFDQSLNSLTLVSQLSESGYSCYGVSANGFACQRTGFYTGFDEFYYSRGREQYPDGLNVSGFALGRLQESRGTLGTGYDTLRAALRHEQPLKSPVNIGAVGLGSAAVRSSLLQPIPHRLCVSDSAYNYTPATNTRRLVDAIKRESSTADPFFAFANYMDTHRPYAPSAEKQQQLGRVLSSDELKRLNDEVADLWGFVAKDASDDISDEDIKTVCGLYAGEVETVDEHLGKLIKTLIETRQFEDTLIIVTSGHGENLGETDEMGRRRMGHESSMSNALANVPLVMTHPALKSADIEQPFSLTEIHRLLCRDLQELLNKGDLSVIFETDDPFVACEYPATGGEEMYEKYIEVPTDILDHRIRENAVAVYTDNWRVSVETTGEQWAFTDGNSVPFNEAPEAMQNRSLSLLSQLDSAGDKNDVTAEQEAQPEALGYM